MIISTIGGSAVAIENLPIDNEHSISTPYEYPIKPGTEEWFAIESHSLKAEMCQIPNDILTQLTTEALIETVVNYPFFSDMGAFSTPELGYTTVRGNFNGLQELERRNDGAEKLLSYYHALESQQTHVNFLCFVSIEITLQQPEIPAHMTQKTRENITIPNENMRVLFPESNTLGRLVYPKTPNGTQVTKEWCRHDQPEMTQKQRDDINEEVLADYGLSPLRQPTTKYNCHSYAWYSKSSTNLWWIDWPDDFMNDSYYKVNTGTVSLNNIVVYRDSASSSDYLDSGIVTGVSSGSGTPNRPPVTVTSKWGAYGLYEHNIYNCPAIYGRNVKYYKVA